MSQKQYAIITGAASGLGRALAVALAAEGWHIALADVNDAGSDETLAAVRRAGGDGQTEHLDVADREQWEALINKLKAEWPGLDLLVNNAGVGVSGEVGQVPPADWQWIMGINLWGPIYGCHATLDWMKQSPGGHVVNVASMAAVVSAPGMAPYNVTKGGLFSFSETLYGELRPLGIGVTVVCPWFVPTNIVRNARYQSEQQVEIAQKLMDEATCTAEDVARRIIRAIRRKDLYLFVPGIARFFWRLKRLMPVSLLKLIVWRNARETARLSGS